MDDAAAIARLLRPHGLVVGPDDFGDTIAPGLRGQLELYHEFTGDVGCVFLANLGFNAVAASDGARHAIGINVGAVMLIARYAYCLFSDPLMFPTVGEPSREHVDAETVAALRNPVAQKTSGRSLPRDPTRVQAAEQLSVAAYLVLFFHELGHIQLGHLGFIKHRFGATAHREITVTPLAAEHAALLRALEWEADAGALYRSLRVWRELWPLYDEPGLAPLTPDESWFLAVDLLFWIMDFAQPVLGFRALATHPSPLARRVNAARLTSAADWVPAVANDSSPLIPWIVRNAFPSPALANPHFGSTDHIERELRETARDLAALLPALEPHRRSTST
jgi:hypothetical protein